jgi:hypothetical protein
MGAYIPIRFIYTFIYVLLIFYIYLILIQIHINAIIYIRLCCNIFGPHNFKFISADQYIYIHKYMYVSEYIYISKYRYPYTYVFIYLYTHAYIRVFEINFSICTKNKIIIVNISNIVLFIGRCLYSPIRPKIRRNM